MLFPIADVVELVDTLDLGSSAARRGGSTPFDLNALLKVQVSAADYQDKVDAVIKNYRKTANVPGFRKGKVPVGQIKKMYGKAILVEEVKQAHPRMYLQLYY